MRKEEWIRERRKKLEAKEQDLTDEQWLRHGYSLIAAQNELHLILEQPEKIRHIEEWWK